MMMTGIATETDHTCLGTEVPIPRWAQWTLPRGKGNREKTKDKRQKTKDKREEGTEKGKREEARGTREEGTRGSQSDSFTRSTLHLSSLISLLPSPISSIEKCSNPAPALQSRDHASLDSPTSILSLGANWARMLTFHFSSLLLLLTCLHDVFVFGVVASLSLPSSPLSLSLPLPLSPSPSPSLFLSLPPPLPLPVTHHAMPMQFSCHCMSALQRRCDAASAMTLMRMRNQQSRSERGGGWIPARHAVNS